MRWIAFTLFLGLLGCSAAPQPPPLRGYPSGKGTDDLRGEQNQKPQGGTSEEEEEEDETTRENDNEVTPPSTPEKPSSEVPEKPNQGMPEKPIPQNPDKPVTNVPEVMIPITAERQLKTKEGYCLQNINPKNDAVGIVEQRNCTGSKMQTFVLEKSGGDFYRIKNSSTNACLGIPDVKINIYKKDAHVTQRGVYSVKCGQDRDEWKLVENATGARFESKTYPGKCLAMDRSMPYQRSVADLETCGEAPNQNYAIAPFKAGDPIASDPPLTLDERCTLRVNLHDITTKMENTRIVRENFAVWTKDQNKRFREYVRDHCKLMYKTAPDRVPEARYIDLVLEDTNEYGAYVWNGALSFDKVMVFNGAFMSSAENKNKPEAINGIFAHELTHIWQKFRSGPSYAKMSGVTEGIGDAYKYINPQVSESIRFDLNGDDWDAGYGKTAGVLLYIDKAQPGFLTKLNLDIESFVGTWDPARIKALTGKEAIEWWNQYKSDPNCPNPRVGGYCK